MVIGGSLALSLLSVAVVRALLMFLPVGDKLITSSPPTPPPVMGSTLAGSTPSPALMSTAGTTSTLYPIEHIILGGPILMANPRPKTVAQLLEASTTTALLQVHAPAQVQEQVGVQIQAQSSQLPDLLQVQEQAQSPAQLPQSPEHQEPLSPEAQVQVQVPAQPSQSSQAELPQSPQLPSPGVEMKEPEVITIDDDEEQDDDAELLDFLMKGMLRTFSSTKLTTID